MEPVLTQALILAATQHNLEAMELLLQHGADPNGRFTNLYPFEIDEGEDAPETVLEFADSEGRDWDVRFLLLRYGLRGAEYAYLMTLKDFTQPEAAAQLVDMFLAQITGDNPALQVLGQQHMQDFFAKCLKHTQLAAEIARMLPFVNLQDLALYDHIAQNSNLELLLKLLLELC